MHVSVSTLCYRSYTSISKQILAATRLRILPHPFSPPNSHQELPPLYAGQPISATLTIETSFHWAPLEDMDKPSYRMRFDVEEMTKDWLVSGRKRGDFVSKVSPVSSRCGLD